MAPPSEAAFLRELVRRFGDGDDGGTSISQRVLEGLFPAQRAFVEDPARRKGAVCSRRAGKTHAAARFMLATADRYPASLIPYIGLTRISAKRILWPVLQALDREMRLGLKFNHTELTATLPNGSTLLLTGADKADEIEKLRGSKYPLVVLDECQSFGAHIEALVDEVLEPATIDYDGSIVMLGTPAAACAGMFYEAMTAPAGRWAVHHWTLLDNPSIPHAESWLAEMRAAHGWEEAHPIYQREWKGRWVRSLDSLVYRFRDDANVYDTLPQAHPWLYGLGVDVGFSDATAMTVGAWTAQDPKLYVPEVFRRSGMTVEEVALKIRSIRERYRLAYIVIDEGGLGKMIAEELRTRYGIPCEQADKRQKPDAIEIVNGEFLAGRIQIHRSCRDLIGELRLLQWDADKPGKEDERFPNDTCDSFLYMARAARHYLHRPAAPPVPTEVQMRVRALAKQRARREDL